MYQKKPEWLKIKIGNQASTKKVEEILSKYRLNTVCRSANCPNRAECFGRRTATFMILGNVCTRNCRFCNVAKGKPEEVDKDEPLNIAKAAHELNLKHVVVTTVTRDDLKDGGASHFAQVIRESRKLNPDMTIEVLISDLRGDKDALKIIVDAKPDIINHNVETVKELYKEVRPMAVYERSLELLKRVKEMDSSIITKTGFMVGLGETKKQVTNLLKDIRKVDCDALTIGQYLQPSVKHHPVIEYVTPMQFEKYKEEALSLGFRFVVSSPLARSSYYAEKIFEK